MPLTHDTIRRFRLLRWILKDRPEIITFSLFFPFYSSIIISEERRMALTSIYHISTCAVLRIGKYTCERAAHVYSPRLGCVGCVETMDDFG